MSSFPPEHWRALEKGMLEMSAFSASREDMRRCIEQAAGYGRMAELAERKGAPKEERAQCATCMFYRSKGYPEIETGSCYRYPPQVNDVEVLGTCWCGEWKQRNG